MSLEDLEASWADAERELTRKLQLNQRLVASIQVERTRSALDGHVRGLAFEALSAIVGILLAGGYAVAHRGNPGLLVPAGLLAAFAAAVLADVVRQIAAARRVDYGRPVVDIQRRLETLRRMRIAHLRWVFVGATAAWVPLSALFASGFLGIAASRLAHSRWFVANVFFGFAVIGAGWWLARRYGDRAERSPALRRIMQDLAGPNLSAAERFLAQLAEFERS